MHDSPLLAGKLQGRRHAEAPGCMCAALRCMCCCALPMLCPVSRGPAFWLLGSHGMLPVEALPLPIAQHQH